MKNDESKNGGTSVVAEETATTDVAPSNSQAPDTGASPYSSTDSPAADVVAAPPDNAPNLAVSDDIAEQIAADSTMPPSPQPASASSTETTGVELPGVATPPDEPTEPNTAESAGPSDVIQEQINQDEAAPVAAVAKAPKVHNPAQSAVIITLLLMCVLAGLAVFAYMSSQ